ncbi:MAG: PorT family protein [Bacteroidales bacterium]|nr:PorT family protein [Bacteroidales bacterium]
MKTITRLCIITLLISLSTTSKAQILISLFFGDALNTEEIEFGLVGGLNRSYWLDVDESSGLNNFNLGFYFHINMFETSYLSTGVLVKSNVGASGMPTYSIGVPDFDDVFSEGELTTQINYFYVPIMWHQRFNNRFYLEGGLQLGLRYKAYDYFHLEEAEIGGEVDYKRDVRDDYTRFDLGLLGGFGYKVRKQTKSTAIGINYYYGLLNVSRIPDMNIKNSSVYLYVKIPIGTHKKEELPD